MIVPKIFDQARIIAAQSTRLSDFQTQLVEFSSISDPFDRALSKKLFLEALQISESNLAYSQQVHNNKVLIATEPVHAVGYDAIITSKKGVFACVSVADCAPILIHDSKNSVIAAIHAGWRGTVAKIVTNTLNEMQEKFGTEGKNCKAFIGACISKKNFEVGEEVAAQFSNEEKEFDASRNKYLVDLKLSNKNQLLKFGIPECQIEISHYCTVEDNSKFYSYRFEKGKTGRMLAIIGMK